MLTSPGVEVQVIDESFYTPAAPGTVPLIVVASAQDKSNASATGTAQGTTSANAGKVYVITSQRDLTDTFGTPFFYTDATGNSVHGSEINEYGLQAAYSLLGVSSRAYVVRADIDLDQLQPTSSAPTGDPVSGTYWFDTDSTLYGINEWDAVTNKFTTKTPLIINDDNVATAASGGTPLDSFGAQGDYLIYAVASTPIQLWYKTTATSNSWVTVQNTFNGGKSLTIAPHTSYPDFTTSTGNSAVTGSVWIKSTSPGRGANYSVKYYSGATQTWSTVPAPIYTNSLKAIDGYDLAGGGTNIAVGSLYVEADPAVQGTDLDAEFKLWRRNASGNMAITSGAATTATNASETTFLIRETVKVGNNWTWGSTVTAIVAASTTTSVASRLPTLLANSLTNVSVTFNNTTNKLTVTHLKGGDIEFDDQWVTSGIFTATNANLYTIIDGSFDYIATNWKPLVYEAKNNAPTTDPADGTLWYNNVVDEVDIMIHDGTKWVGYRNYSQTSGTDPKGPLVKALEPVDGDRSDGGNLVNGDIWISTANMERYGKDIYVYDAINKAWVLQDVTDQTSPDGWVFADARWATSGATLTASSIENLLTSNYVDPDAPDPALYPRGIKLWNTRRSGFNVKRYVKNHINILANEGLNQRYPYDSGESMENYETDRWISASPNNEDGSGTFGRKAQRATVVRELKSLIDTNSAIRDTDTVEFNLLACPGYPEVIQNLISLNVDRGITAFVVGDTPMRLEPNGTALSNWGNNNALAFDNGDDGAVSYDEYMGMFYPAGFTNDNAGNRIVVPASHMMLRTIVNSDSKSYQWFAPAGTRRGGVDNATSVGYIDGLTGEFRTVSLYESLRDVLATVKVNPIATMPGVGIVNMGQYTRARNASALDRINVARLVVYLRRQLAKLAKPFLFEPNDAQTRREIKAAAESLMLELVGQRALYDFIVVCDESNNTPARIDRSELYMDIAIEPVKAVEFIYIPLRIKNTGDIAAGL
jgi:hypothetical protein